MGTSEPVFHFGRDSQSQVLNFGAKAQLKSLMVVMNIRSSSACHLVCLELCIVKSEKFRACSNVLLSLLYQLLSYCISFDYLFYIMITWTDYFNKPWKKTKTQSAPSFEVENCILPCNMNIYQQYRISHEILLKKKEKTCRMSLNHNTANSFRCSSTHQAPQGSE